MIQQYRVEKKEDLTIVHPKQHKHTLLWIHGMGEPHDKYVKKIVNALGANADYFKIIIPKAPIRFFTLLGAEYTSWFDAYIRGEIRFIIPFEEGFNVKQIYDSFQRILLPIIEKQSPLVKSIGGKFIVAGFSQGCGLSIHCLYTKPQLVDAAIGVSGYFFPITKYDPKLNDRLYLIYGKSDTASEWKNSKISYYGKISQKKVNLIQGMGHQVNKDTQKAIGQAVSSIVGYIPKL